MRRRISTSIFPLTHSDALEQLLRAQTDPSSPSYHQWLTPAQFKAQFGPDRSDVAKVTAALLPRGFTITAEHTQSLEVEGPVSAVEKMFSTQLMQVRTPNGHMKFAAGEHHLTLPDTLASVGAVIPEFTTHLAAHVHSRKTAVALSAVKSNFRLSSNDSLFYPNDLNERINCRRSRLRLIRCTRDVRHRSPAWAPTSASSSLR